MKTSTLILFSVLLFRFAAGQNLSAFSDYKNYFYVFDDGTVKELEYQPIQSYKVGGNSVAYVDNTGNFKIYFDGYSTSFLDIPPSDYYATDDLVVYYKNRILSVFDNGKVNKIAYYTDNYVVGDSIVATFDQNTSTLRVYYNGQVRELETMIGQTAFTTFKTGDNILAYQNYDNHFKIFYHQQVVDMENNAPLSYQAGSNTVAYVDGYTQLFKVFHKGITYTLENVPPASYIVADDMVSYVDGSGNFKIFYMGQMYKVSSFEPTSYESVDKIVVYVDKTNFNVFYKGAVTLLESYVPEKYQKDYNCLAYIDRRGYLKAFYDGELKKIYDEKINSFELTRNVLRFDTGLNDQHFFSNGKVINH